MENPILLVEIKKEEFINLLNIPFFFFFYEITVIIKNNIINKCFS